MKFNIWTFIFQLINFVVLLLLLRRLLYRPVKEIMEKRRAAVRKTLEDAEKTKQEASSLKEEYEKKKTEIDRLREDVLDKAEEEAETRRKEILRKAEEEAKVLFQKERARLDFEKKKIESELKENIVDTSLSFSASILSGLSDINLHNRILEKLMESVPDIVKEIKDMSIPTEGLTVEIVSAYPFPDSFKERILQDFKPEYHGKISVNAVIEPGLISGAVIRILDMVYDASLSGQLKAFGEKLRKAH
jgi:F-type H+-transporting ATPase subunit b